MNLAIGSMTFGRNHRFVFGSLIAALLGATILTGVAVWQFAGTGSSASAGDPPVALPAVSPVAPYVQAGSKIYIVASEAAKQTLLQGAVEGAKFEEINYVEPTILVIEPLDQEFLQLMIDGQIEFGSFNLVDLR